MFHPGERSLFLRILNGPKLRTLASKSVAEPGAWELWPKTLMPRGFPALFPWAFKSAGETPAGFQSTSIPVWKAYQTLGLKFRETIAWRHFRFVVFQLCALISF